MKFIVTAIAELGHSRWIANSRPGTHPCCPRVSTHAEVAVMGKVPRQCRKNVVIRVYRVMAGGSFGMAKPCVWCQAYLFQQGVLSKNVYWTDENGVWRRGI